MWRGFLAIVLVYIYGYSTFDGYRPQRINRPIQAFHNEAIKAGREAVETISHSDERALRYGGFIAGRVSQELTRSPLGHSDSAMRILNDRRLGARL